VPGDILTFRANVRTVRRPWDSGCWQAKVCTFCHTAASCFGGWPERGARWQIAFSRKLLSAAITHLS
jgi:hypothetical protein